MFVSFGHLSHLFYPVFCATQSYFVACLALSTTASAALLDVVNGLFDDLFDLADGLIGLPLLTHHGDHLSRTIAP